MLFKKNRIFWLAIILTLVSFTSKAQAEQTSTFSVPQNTKVDKTYAEYDDVVVATTFGEVSDKNRSNIEHNRPVLSINPKGVLLKDGQPYRAVGVNYFSALNRSILNPNDKSYIAGFNELADYKIPFIRVMFGGFWPNELKLYQNNPNLYFKIVDAFVNAAEKKDIGIVASLNWNFASAADLVGEPASSVGKKNSKTQAFMVQYARDMVQRYGNRKGIWVWEFGNEMSLYADLPNSKLFRPKVNPAKGTPILRNPLDELSSTDAVYAYKEFAKSVLEIKPNAVLSTGNALPRKYAYHNTYHKKTLRQWDLDSEAEFCKVLLHDNPKEYGLVSIHIYPNEKDGYFGASQMEYKKIIEVAGKCAKQSGRVLFVGEFGVDSQKYQASHENEQNEFKKILNAIETNTVPLSALWVYDFSFQAESFNVKGGLRRAYQLDEIKKLNEELKLVVEVSHE